MINLRLGRWLAFTILVLVFLSTLAPAQETSPQEQTQIVQAVPHPAEPALPSIPALPDTSH